VCSTVDTSVEFVHDPKQQNATCKCKPKSMPGLIISSRYLTEHNCFLYGHSGHLYKRLNEVDYIT
jgi:hypothetical protein